MMERVTVTEPIVGWRSYSVGTAGLARPLTFTNLTSSGWLAGPSASTRRASLLDGQLLLLDDHAFTYAPGSRYRSVCVFDSCERRGVQRPLPWEACACGFYCHPDLETTLEYLLRHVVPWQAPAFLIGPVLLDGEVVEHERGYRATDMVVLPFEYAVVQEDLLTRQSLSHEVMSSPVDWNRWTGTRMVTWKEYRDAN